MQVILDSSFARPGSAPIWGGKKGESRDWTSDFRNLGFRPRNLPRAGIKIQNGGELDLLFII